MKLILIIGIDNILSIKLYQYFLYKNYTVIGLTNQDTFNYFPNPNLFLRFGEILNTMDIYNTLNWIVKKWPESTLEIYYNQNMYTSKIDSFDIAEYALTLNVIGTVKLLECIHNLNLFSKIKFCNIHINIDTIDNPNTPYELSKLSTFNLIKIYRNRYNSYLYNIIIKNINEENIIEKIESSMENASPIDFII